MTSISEMSESEALEYIRAELQVLQPILGELISVFWMALVDQWEHEGRPGVSPVDRRYPPRRTLEYAADNAVQTKYGKAIGDVESRAGHPSEPVLCIGPFECVHPSADGEDFAS
jgi:hypothetical protein